MPYFGGCTPEKDSEQLKPPAVTFSHRELSTSGATFALAKDEDTENHIVVIASGSVFVAEAILKRS